MTSFTSQLLRLNPDQAPARKPTASKTGDRTRSSSAPIRLVIELSLPRKPVALPDSAFDDMVENVKRMWKKAVKRSARKR